jgi:hypothetical protein
MKHAPPARTDSIGAGAPDVFENRGSPVGAGAPNNQSSIQFYGKSDGSLDVEFWFAGKPQRLPVNAFEKVAVAIGDAEREVICPVNCASAVEAFLRALVDCRWTLVPPLAPLAGKMQPATKSTAEHT